MRDIPQSAIALIKTCEGLCLNRYIDAAGHATIGYGHKIVSGENYESITEEQAEELLLKDAYEKAYGLLKLTTSPLNDNQFAALLDFVFNLGLGTYQRSTLRMKINRGDFISGPKEILRYIYANGKILPGLLKRRQLEAKLFSTQ